MSFSFIKRLTLVGRGGVGLARIPRETDAEIQLQSGLLSAMISFSKEVHQSELEGLTMHDRTLSILKIDTYNLIVEFSNAIDKSLMSRILEQMEMELAPRLKEHGDFLISIEEAESLLAKVSQQEWIDNVLNNFGLDRPLGMARIVKLGEISLFDEYIGTVINKLVIFDKPFMLPLVEEKVCLYVVPMNNTYNYLQIPISREIQLFRLAPLLRREFDYLSPMDLNHEMMMERLRSMPDLGFQLNQVDEELISLKFLKDNIKKRLDAAVDGIIKGESVIVIGEKITAKIVVNTLQIFTQHIHTNVNPWLDKDAENLPEGTTGMNLSKFQDLESKGLIGEDQIIVNLEDKKVLNGRDNKYIQKSLKNIEKKDLTEVIEDINSKLENLVEISLKVTGLLSLPIDDAKDQLSEIKKQINNNDQFQFVLAHSSQRNSALEALIEDLSATLQSAESFLGEF